MIARVNKIAITGHTSGIGKAIFERMLSYGHEVTGFSRSNGFDIEHPDAIIDAVRTSTVFVNNAHSSYAQVNLLQRLYPIWKDLDKTIICIGSNAPESTGRLHPYGTEKAALDHACDQLAPLGRCRVVNLKLGYVDTPRVATVRARKLAPETVADTVSWLLGLPNHVQVPTLKLLPR
jgi:NADP-dependent 3-hydroxy acid dehydrogenase YdfG